VSLTFEITVDANMLEAELDKLFEDLRVPVQDQAAITLSDIVLQNFGDEGVDRPEPWPMLSPLYAVRAHGGDRTPREILSGDFRSSIDVELGNPEHSRVFAHVDYSGDQQWGSMWGNHVVPPRPVFPIRGNEDHAELTEYSEGEIRNAVVRVIEEKLAAL